MDSPKDVRRLLKYLDGELSTDEASAMERFLSRNPEYKAILKGLTVLKKNYHSSQELLDFLHKRKAQLKKGLFRK